jgi:hypothetical protein
MNENSGRRVNQIDVGNGSKPNLLSPVLPPGNVGVKEKFYSTDEE